MILVSGSDVTHALHVTNAHKGIGSNAQTRLAEHGSLCLFGGKGRSAVLKMKTENERRKNLNVTCAHTASPTSRTSPVRSGTMKNLKGASALEACFQVSIDIMVQTSVCLTLERPCGGVGKCLSGRLSVLEPESMMF